MSKSQKNLLTEFAAVIGIIAILAFFGPSDETLGPNVRIVYLHGAWVLTAEVAFTVAGLTGLVGLISRREAWNDWSAALGRTGLFFWLTYIPLSLWAMEANWNGLFLVEPRFRLAITFAVVGLLLQFGLWIIRLGWLTSAANIIYIVILRIVFSAAQYVMHPPPSPIFNSGNWQIIGFFIALNLLCWIAAYFMSRWFIELARKKPLAGNGQKSG